MSDKLLEAKDLQERIGNWDEFLTLWPYERVKTMSLEEYSDPGKQTSFTYWLEFGTPQLGSIKGGDSSKFGIYRRKSEPKGTRSHILHGQDYSWKKNLGENEEQAFANVKGQLIEVIEAARNGELEVIQRSPLPNTIKWKAAFLYQHRENPCVLAIFTESVFQRACKSTNISIADANEYLVSKKPQDIDVLSYSYWVWANSQAPAEEVIEKLNAKLSMDEVSALNSHKQELLFQLMESVHEMGLDIYRLSKEHQIRIGRKERVASKQATAKFAKLNISKRDIRVVIKDTTVSLEWESLDDIVQQASEFADEYQVERAGYWPKDYVNSEEVEESIVIPKKVTLPLNQILYGPPGTGKTYHTANIAVQLVAPNYQEFDNRQKLMQLYSEKVEEGKIQFVTFHQNYGYEEFIEGLRAKTTDDGNIHYTVEPGIFKQIAKQAIADPANNYLLIIDEINRGNMSKIFGELITLIESSKRINATDHLELRLPTSGDPFSLPDNLFILGTMNTADRSLAMMDTALRRRFDFIEMMPKPELFKDEPNIKGINLRQLLKTLNQRIEVLYDREHMLGHAFFMPVQEALEQQGEDTAFDVLVSVFKNKVIPLLEEYFFEDWDKIRLVLADNQKRDQQSCFVTSKVLDNAELSGLFGPKHNLNQYGQVQTRYELATEAASVWSEPSSYIQIYQAVSE